MRNNKYHTFSSILPIEIEDYLEQFRIIPEDLLEGMTKDLLSPEDTERKRLATRWLELYVASLPEDRGLDDE